MRGFLAFLMLRFISKKNMSGDEIRDELEKRKGCRPSAGTVYPVLKFLKEEELILEVGDGGKVKKYTITPEGKKELTVATRRFVQIFYDMEGEFERCR
jgi:DNA-binding PadR family transcriptional regulator